MRVLVTGATGFLGGHLCRFLHDRDYDVIGTGRSARGCMLLAEQGIEVYRADLSQASPSDVSGRVDAIVHAAALSAPSGPLAGFIAANIDATQNMIDMAKVLGVGRFVNISSPSVYFALKDQLGVTEDCLLPKPFNHYARTKADAERLVMSTAEIGPISLRPRGIYGSGDAALLPRLLITARSTKLPLFRGGRAKIDLTHVSDVCTAIEAAIHAGPEAEGQVFNVAGGEVLPVKQIIDMACQRADVTPFWRPMPFWPTYLAANAAERVSALMPSSEEPRISAYAVALLAFEQSLNISKAARLLGWRPAVRFEEGLIEAIGDRSAS